MQASPNAFTRQSLKQVVMSYTVQLKIHLKQVFFFLVIILIGSVGTGFFLKYKVLVLVATVVVI